MKAPCPPTAGRRDVLAGLLATGASPFLFPAGAFAGRKPRDGLNALFDTIMRQRLTASPELATGLGLDTGALSALKHRLDDRSPDGIAVRKRETADQVRRLGSIDATRLPPRDAINFQAVRTILSAQDDMARRFAYGGAGTARPYTISQLTGAYTTVPSLLDSKHGIASRDDADAYLDRVRQFAVELRHEAAMIRQDARAGVTPPAFVQDRAMEQLKILRDQAAQGTALVAAIGTKAKAAGLTRDYEAILSQLGRSEIAPAIEAQISAMSALRAAAVDDAGVWRLPDGEAFYESALRMETTAGDGPDELHRTGIAMADEIGRRLDEALAVHGYGKGGRLQRMIALLGDSRFVYANDEGGKAKLMTDLSARLDDMRERLRRAFRTLPAAKLEIRRVPAFLEAGAPFAYYEHPTLDGRQPGIFYVSLRNTAEVPSWVLTTTSFHEAIPGHHLQESLVQEDSSLPLICKVLSSNGYNEGWGLYAEQLADELGMYDTDPIGRIGYLWADLLRAARMVCDTGIHHKRWTRDQAIRWMSGNGGFPPGLATGEVERYCVWPGQACSYMVGKITWNRLRDHARQALGADYDIRDFHAATLAAGPVPLQILPAVVDHYIAAVRARRAG